ncbi:unnamed protein product [Urochloa humidicola]
METELPVTFPDDVLEDILGRLPARSLAASRQVCKAWCSMVDDRQLLLRLRHLLPHAVHVLFVNYVDHSKPHFFARPTSPSTAIRHRIDGRFRFIVRRRRNSRYPVITDRRWYTVVDHCNGLILISHDHLGPDKTMYLCNPATRRWARLPPPCPRSFFGRTFVVFDPAAASPPRYEVLWTQREPENPKGNKNIRRYLAGLDARGADDDGESTEAELEMEYDSWRLTEWPPLRWMWREFSSRTGRWEDRVFVREGEAAGTLGDLFLREWDYIFQPRWRYVAYWQGALYVHCRGEYVSRLSLANNRYQVIKSPIDLATCSKKVISFLGKSEKGVYFGTIDACQLDVWILDESHGQTQWALMHHSALKPDAWKKENCYERSRVRPWILDDDSAKEKRRRSSLEQNVEWDSDDDNVIDDADVDPYGDIYFLGFHPYKEVIFLSDLCSGVAYHLDTCKTQYLGKLSLGVYNRGLDVSFVYTPCVIGV